MRPYKMDTKIPKWIKKVNYVSRDDLYELAYWRRYWKLRGEIFYEIGTSVKTELEGFGTVYVIGSCTLSQIYSVVRRAYSTPTNFQESNGGYWWWGIRHYLTFNIWQGIKMLRAIKWAIKHSDEVEVFFYDSY